MHLYSGPYSKGKQGRHAREFSRHLYENMGPAFERAKKESEPGPGGHDVL